MLPALFLTSGYDLRPFQGERARFLRGRSRRFGGLLGGALSCPQANLPPFRAQRDIPTHRRGRGCGGVEDRLLDAPFSGVSVQCSKLPVQLLRRLFRRHIIRERFHNHSRRKETPLKKGDHRGRHPQGSRRMEQKKADALCRRTARKMAKVPEARRYASRRWNFLLSSEKHTA